MDYSLADLEKATGAKRRSIQLWADAGVIRAYPRTDRRGTGTHRRFSRDEAIMACIIKGLADRQRPIGELLRLSTSIRAFLNSGADRKLLEAAIGGAEQLMALKWTDQDTPEVFVVPRAELDYELFYEHDTEKRKLFKEVTLIPLRDCLKGMRR
jgi:hypothetical protein